MTLIVMGVSGSGKSTIGEILAGRLGLPYFEADTFHPKANIQKMSEGIPLNDDDRRPWLEIIRNKIKEVQIDKGGAVFSCSALKESYRRFLEEELPFPVQWIYLKGSFDTILKRMSSRESHFFKAEMLESQFADLEEPENALTVEIDKTADEILDLIISRLA